MLDQRGYGIAAPNPVILSEAGNLQQREWREGEPEGVLPLVHLGRARGNMRASHSVRVSTKPFDNAEGILPAPPYAVFYL